MIRPHNKTLISLALIGALAAPGAYANTDTDNSTQETTGMGAGALFGAVVAGPPGLAIGAIGGALLGRLQHAEDKVSEQDQALEQQRAHTQQLTNHYTEQLAKLEREKVQIAGARMVEAEHAVARGFVYTVHFRTDSAELEPHYVEELKKLAWSMGVFTGLKVHVTGHADPRGSNTHNQALSERRVEAVRQLLHAAGVHAKRLLPQANGETKATADLTDREGQFFDRQVRISFCIDRKPA